MYEMLGISVPGFSEVSIEPLHVESENENEFEENTAEDLEYANISSGSSVHTNTSVNTYNNELVAKDNIISPNSDEYQDEANEPQIKRPFLKRGSGLTKAFRAPPEAFNYKTQPRYKYIDRIKQTLGRNASGKARDPPKEAAPSNEPAPPKKKPEIVQKKKAPPAPAVPKKSQELPAQKESKELVAPSNIVLKLPKEPTQPVSELPIQEWFESRSKQIEICETPKLAKLPKGVSWAQVLSSNNIADSSFKVDQLLNLKHLNESELDETSLFHLLEERVDKMSLDISMSDVMRMLASLRNPPAHQDDDGTLVTPEDPLIDDASSVNVQLEPHPTEINKKIIIDDSTSDENEEEAESETQEEDDEDEHRVRFADKVEVVEEDENLSTDLEAIEQSQTSTPNERNNFMQFKRRLIRGGNKQTSGKRDDLKEKSDLMRAKLAELETEIAYVRQQSSTVDKMRQDIEVDKLQLENDREDMLGQIKDDRIKMELKLHDERVKVEQEKQKLEKMLKNPTKKEREEISKLKEEVEDLKEELKTKEVRHGSTSARYRSQIKQLEKENQSLKLELEVFKKDNKKLELENARLRKDTNNKMLQEINKNIARLAPQQEVKKQSEVAKKPATRKSEPTIKKRVTSVPGLPTHSSSSVSSDDEPVHTSHLRKMSKENNPTRVRRSEPTRSVAATTAISASSSDVLAELKREIVNSDGSKDIWYPNGNLKKISPNGMMIRMLYFNKDIKETNMTEGTTRYYYNETNTWHTTYIDGLEILEYPE